MMQVIGMCILAYLLGSIPSAHLAGKLLRKIDIRQHGSGNVGFANAVRVLGWGPGLLVLFGDLAKGLLPVLLARHLYGEGWQPLVVGACAVAGHVWTIFLHFRGGKGVATSAGVFAGLAPIPFLFALVAYGVMLGLFRYSSLGSLTGAVVLPAALLVQKLQPGGSDPYLGTVAVALVGTVLIFWLHRSNIRRLRQGTERKLAFGRKNPNESPPT
jgi:glycerol-3-phosphate acyltransferase PlsY